MILLTSTTPPVADHLYDRFLKGKNIQSLLFIETAAEIEPGDRQWLEDDHDAWVGKGMSVTRYSISGKNSRDIETEFSRHDIIYMSGGNTFYLLQEMQKTGAMQIVRRIVNEGKIYIGTSAGSVVAGPDISAIKNLDSEKAAPELQGYEGLSLIELVVLPHWGSPCFRESYLRQGLNHLYDNPIYKAVLLTDNQYLSCKEDGLFEIIDVKN